jgi:uncharacterized membrane protein YphA (DoxX/SURF4 family)
MIDREALSDLGGHVYGLAAIAFGIIGLVWGDFATVWQPVAATVPHRAALAYLVAVCLLLAGSAMQWRRTAQAGAVVLTILYFIFALLWLPRVIGYPRMIGTWLGFAEELALAVAGLVAFASLAPRDTAWGVRVGHAGCFLFGLCVITFGLAHFMAPVETAGMVPKWIPPGQHFWAVATGVAHVCAGVAILSGILAVVAARMLTLMLVVFGALVWVPLLLGAPRGHMTWAGNAINLAMVGAAWVVADSIAGRQRLALSEQAPAS